MPERPSMEGLARRVAVLRRHAETEGVLLPYHVAVLIAARCTDESLLMTIVTRLIAHVSLTGRALTPELAHEILASVLPESVH